MITYTLSRKDRTDGRVSLVLHLYRNKKIAHSTTIATLDPTLARKVFVKAHEHLETLGVWNASDLMRESFSGARAR